MQINNETLGFSPMQIGVLTLLRYSLFFVLVSSKTVEVKHNNV